MELDEEVRWIGCRLDVDQFHPDDVRLGGVDDLFALLLLARTDDDVAVGRRLVDLRVDVTQVGAASVFVGPVRMRTAAIEEQKTRP